MSLALMVLISTGTLPIALAHMALAHMALKLDHRQASDEGDEGLLVIAHASRGPAEP